MTPSRPPRRGVILASALLGCLLALATAGSAAAQAIEGAPGSGVVSLDMWDWLGLIARLGAVLAVIWGAFWGLRWYTRRSVAPGHARGELEILETRALGPSRSLQLVRVGRRAVLVGVTPERINQLLEIDDPEEVARLAQALEGQRPIAPALRFAGPLRAILPSLGALTSRAARARSQGHAALGGTSELVVGGQDFAPAAPAAGLQRAATSAYREARLSELQRAIEDARRGTPYERAQ